jgi:hypothetical protein
MRMATVHWSTYAGHKGEYLDLLSTAHYDVADCSRIRTDGRVEPYGKVSLNGTDLWGWER